MVGRNRPTASSAVQPKMRSAAEFQVSTLPSKSTSSTATGEVSITACSLAFVSSRTASARLCSVKSWMTPVNSRRPGSTISLIASSIGNCVPCFRSPMLSRPIPMIFFSPVSR